MQHAQRAIDLTPRDPDAHYTVALVTHLLPGEAARAEAALRHCLVLNPSYAPAHGLLAIVRTVQGHSQEAAEHCARAFALNPQEPLRAVWHWAEAWAAQVLGDDADALAHSTRGVAANPDYPSCHLSAAIAAHRLGDHVLARRCVDFLRGTTPFACIDTVVEHLPQVRAGGEGARFLSDLRAAGLPQSVHTM